MAASDPDALSRLYDERNLALVRLQAVQRDQRRLEAEHDALVARLAVLDAQITRAERALGSSEVVERELARARRMLAREGS